jgi:predicted phosphate transport protein (TIGR00153 family)
MFSFWRSEKRLHEMLAAYLQQVDASLRTLARLFPACLDGSSDILQGEMQNPVHKEESVADDLRRALETELLSGRLLPGSRSEVLAIIEAVDRVPNAAEEIVDAFTIQRLQVPESLHAGLNELLAESLSACTAMNTAVSLLFEDLQRIRELADEVDRIESRVDRLERQLIHRVFQPQGDLAEKLQLRDLVRAIASLADRAEDVTDRTQWLALKRKP